MDCKTALQIILDHVDYTTGACQVNEMIGAVLPKEIIILAKQAITPEALPAPTTKEKCICGDSCPVVWGKRLQSQKREMSFRRFSKTVFPNPQRRVKDESQNLR